VPCARLKKLHKKLPARCKARPKPMPAAGTITSRIRVGSDAGSLAFGFGSLWVRDQTDGTVSRVDPQTNNVVATIRVPFGVGGIAAGEGAVWTSNFEENSVSRIEPASNKITATVDLGPDGAPAGVATTPGAVWVAGHHSGLLYRIDPQTNAVVASVAVGPAGSGGPAGVEVSAGAVWVVVHNASSVVKVDPATNAVVATMHLACVDGEGAADDDTDLWIPSGFCGSGTVRRIDEATNTVVATVQEHLAGAWPIALAAGLGSIWAVNGPSRFPDMLARIDPQTNRVVGRLALPQIVGTNPRIAVAEGAVWVTDSRLLLRVQPAP
jgi:DNA-binding beta-propeller fold protein YncE